MIERPFTQNYAHPLILAVVAVIILIIVVASIKKWGIKSLVYWLIAGLIAYLLISNAILG
ncbi:MAG: hypothetical protein WC372_10470 [Candidatus Neomarinimicrobiota bacterium]